jgi:outer membrane receptor for ferrienterochelin and colicins
MLLKPAIALSQVLLLGLASPLLLSAEADEATKTKTQQERPETDSPPLKPDGKSQLAALSLDFEEVVVTGTRTKQTQIDNPVRVDVITEKDIERKHAADLYEAIKDLPGLSARPITGKEGQEAWIQGISANRVLVLIDGEEVSPSTGSNVDLTQISATGVAKVEIVKGASSVLYGSQAMGGVINVITKEPDYGLHGGLGIEAGSWGSQNSSGDKNDLSHKRYRGNVSYHDETWLLTANFNARLSDGFSEDPEQWTQQGADGQQINARTSARFYFDDGQYLQAAYEHYDQELHNQFVEWIANNPYNRNKQDDAERKHGSIKYFNTFVNSELTISAFVENYENFSSPNGLFTRPATQDKSKLEALWNIYAFSDHTLTLGGLVFSDELSQSKIEQDGTETFEITCDDGAPCETVSRENAEFYIQDEINLGFATTIVPGIRFQDDSDFGTEWTPKISLRTDFVSNEKTNFFMRASVGKGYRVPNLKERYYIFDHSHLGYVIQGNSNLTPESSESYQLGFILTNRKSYQIDINLFQNDLTDLIEYYDTGGFSGSAALYSYKNIGSAQTKGIELNGSYSLTDKFRIKAGYVYLIARNETDDIRLASRPKNQVKGSIDYQTDFEMELSLIGSWQGREVDEANGQTSPNWEQVDFKINQPINNEFSVYGGINNITNTQRDFSVRYDNRPVEGRLVYLGFKFNI